MLVWANTNGLVHKMERRAYTDIMKENAISRQAAIASIKNLYPDMPVIDIFGAKRKWLEKYAPYFECENAIEQLPPVNPQPQMEHCKDCKFCDLIDHKEDSNESINS